MSDLLTREAILSAEDLGTDRVEVPEWGGHLFVRGLTGTERDAFEQDIISVNSKGPKNKQRRIENLRAQLVVKAACTEDGTPIFTGADVVALGKKSAAALDRVYSAASELSGLSAKDEEELVEDFSETQEGSSTSS